MKPGLYTTLYSISLYPSPNDVRSCSSSGTGALVIVTTGDTVLGRLDDSSIAKHIEIITGTGQICYVHIRDETAFSDMFIEVQ